MPHVTRVVTLDGSFEVTYDDQTVCSWSPDRLAAKLHAMTIPIEVDLEASELEAVASCALREGITVDDYIEEAIIEKLLRDG